MVAVALHPLTGRCKSGCCNTGNRKRNWRSWSGVRRHG